MSPSFEKPMDTAENHLVPSIERPLSGPRSSALVLSLNSFFVGVYKLFGFALLLAIVFGMATYLFASAYFHLSTSWIVPEILSPQHDKVARESMHFLEQKYQLRKLQVEKAEVQGELSILEKNLQGKTDYQKAFVAAIKLDEEVNKKFLKELIEVKKGLTKSNPKALQELKSLSEAEEQMLKQAEANNLLDRKEILDRRSSLAHLEMQWVERRQKLANLKRMLGASDTSSAENDLSGNAIERIKNQKDLFETSLETYSLGLRKDPLVRKLQALSDLVQVFEASVDALETSPFVQASKATVTVAFAPYANLKDVDKGSKIYGCFLVFAVCRKIGEVAEVLPGEATESHPFSGRNLRGKFLRIELQKTDWAEKASLVVNRPPFFF